VPSLRLVSFNACSGRSMTDGVADPARFAQAVGATGADVVALQEIDRFQPRSGRVDQSALAADALGGTHRYLGLVHGTPGEDGWSAAPHDHPADGHPADDHPADDRRADDRPADFPAGAASANGTSPTYGVALVTTRPVRSWHVLRLAPARGRYPVPVPSRPPRLLWIPDEPRAAIAAVLDEPRMTVVCTHLSFVPGVNVRQLRRLRSWLADLPGPHVVLGDLNLPGRLPARLTGWTPLVTGPTFPAPGPRVQLDHVLAAGLPAGARVRGRVERLAVSDHCAAVADLDLPAHLPADLPG
jgi:endonuclease/exonuclease/phosphatase family metal-dependent hydrolase